MIVYRLSTAKYANDLTGEGAKIYGGRWNPIGVAALYLSEFISLSILEILVRTDKKNVHDRWYQTGCYQSTALNEETPW